MFINNHFTLDMTGCPEGKARLVGGAFDQEGRVEVCSNGVWISICQSGWNAIDAYVLCNQLGYTGTSESFNEYIILLITRDNFIHNLFT